MRQGCSFLVILVLFLSTSFAWTQVNYATLGGLVIDPQHLAVAHANVKLTSTTTGAERSDGE